MHIHDVSHECIPIIHLTFDCVFAVALSLLVVRHGRGSMHFGDGSSLTGIWHFDELNGFAVYRFEDGRRLGRSWLTHHDN